MASFSRAAMLAMMGLVAALLSPAVMSYDFNNETCPTLENMVRAAVVDAIETDAGVVPGLLRITFNDCFPQGCDGSLLLTGEGSEQDMPQNIGLRQNALDLIESIRATVHQTCGRTVSCADITNLATKMALMENNISGYEVPLGRDDSLGPATKEQVGILPGPDDKLHKIVETFLRRGRFDMSEVVALSGAHTIGRASCESFKNRKGENADFVRELRRNCSWFPVAPLQDLDIDTPNTFDNKYYSNLLNNTGVLNSDMELVRNEYTRMIVEGFSEDNGWFLGRFGEAMTKMAHLEGAPATLGEIRANCFKVNGPAHGIAASA